MAKILFNNPSRTVLLRVLGEVQIAELISDTESGNLTSSARFVNTLRQYFGEGAVARGQELEVVWPKDAANYARVVLKVKFAPADPGDTYKPISIESATFCVRRGSLAEMLPSPTPDGVRELYDCQEKAERFAIANYNKMAEEPLTAASHHPRPAYRVKKATKLEQIEEWLAYQVKQLGMEAPKGLSELAICYTKGAVGWQSALHLAHSGYDQKDLGGFYGLKGAVADLPFIVEGKVQFGDNAVSVKLLSHLQATSVYFTVPRYYERCRKMRQAFIRDMAEVEPKEQVQVELFAPFYVGGVLLEIPSDIVTEKSAGGTSHLDAARARWDSARDMSAHLTGTTDCSMGFLTRVDNFVRAFDDGQEGTMTAAKWKEKYTREYWLRADKAGNLPMAVVDAAYDASRLIELQ